MRKIGISITSVGIIVSIFGIIFFLQGNSIVGPTSSFMYSNPKWIVNGLWVASAGITVIAIGIWFILRCKKPL
jgi:hypothetical protein